jgi:hypothetical protein
VGASIAVFDLLSRTTELRDGWRRTQSSLRAAMTAAGFEIKPGEHPIVPIMLYDERLAHDMARRLLERGIYVIGFSFPVVPRGQARIRVQLSAAHQPRHIERAVEAFTAVGRETRRAEDSRGARWLAFRPGLAVHGAATECADASREKSGLGRRAALTLFTPFDNFRALLHPGARFEPRDHPQAHTISRVPSVRRRQAGGLRRLRDAAALHRRRREH